jgi:hypothetical protein
MDRSCTTTARAATTGVALAVLLGAAGCALPAPAEEPPRPVAVVVEGAPDCTTSSDAWLVPAPGAEQDPVDPTPPAGSVPEELEPVAAVLCGWSTDTLDDAEGRWSTRVETTWTGDLEPLLTALAVPDEPGGTGACTADMEIVPDLWLTSADGRSVRAAWPTDSCRKTLPGTQDALDALHGATERLVPVALVETRAALDAGCRTRASLPWTGAGASTTDLVLPHAADLDRACVYAVDPPEPAPELLPGTDASSGTHDPLSGAEAQAGMPTKATPTGTFARVVPIGPDAATRLVQAAGSSSTPGLEGCAAAGTTFATFPVEATDASSDPVPVLTAELDGCGRLLTSDGGARPLSEELTTLLRG